MRQFAIHAREKITCSPTLTLRFNQLLLFHSLMLLAVSLFASRWFGQVSIIDLPLAWGLMLLLPIVLVLSLLLRHQVTRYSLNYLFGVWMLLWVLG
ncbi:hypothetical protein [Shewanella morhuae]|uniref:hypothetical protein n=1 Tax=Shewanella morhuae TaxID=365591 RepID=UPI001BC71DA0|nr:hypothetical protein [Shewanella morhuae]GIU09433.1 hypothetical protein TUM4641_24800 [Shewanella morhuae]